MVYSSCRHDYKLRKDNICGSSTLLLILINLLLKPLAEKLDPNYEFDEDGNIYQISITCDDKKEFFVRSMIINEMETSAFKLVSLESIDVS